MPGTFWIECWTVWRIMEVPWCPSMRDVPPLLLCGRWHGGWSHGGSWGWLSWAPGCPPLQFPSRGFCLTCYVRTPLHFSEAFHVAFRPLLLAAPGLGRFPEGRLVVLVWLPVPPETQLSSSRLSGSTLWAWVREILCLLRGPGPYWPPSCARSARLPKATLLVVVAWWFLHFTQVLNYFRSEPWPADSAVSYLEAVFYRHTFTLSYLCA